MTGKCLFSECWFENPSYKLWLEQDSDKYKAKCRVCIKTFDVSNMGELALASHEEGKKHINLMEMQQRSTTVDIRTILSHNIFSGSQPATGSSISRTTASASSNTGNTSAGVSAFVTRNDALSAEVWWALKVNSSHYSYKSCQDINVLARQMFSDSEIAKKFTCGEKKASYFTCFAIAPYFKSLLKEKVKYSDGYVMSGSKAKGIRERSMCH